MPDFGLLFYDTRSTRLAFVRCGERLIPPPFTGPRRVFSVRADGEARVPGGSGGAAGAGADPTDAPREGVAPGRPALSRLLDDLVVEGRLLVVVEAQ